LGFLCCFNGFEVALLGKAGSSLVGGGGGAPRGVGGRVKLTPKDREDGGPPWLGSMGGSLERWERGTEGSDAG